MSIIQTEYRDFTDEDKNGSIVSLAVRKYVKHPTGDIIAIIDRDMKPALWKNNMWVRVQGYAVEFDDKDILGIAL